jgi:hypothetical protein
MESAVQDQPAEKTGARNAEIFGTFYVGDRGCEQSNQNEHMRIADAALAPEARHVYSFQQVS